MGVYIKGMEMPRSCFYCPFQHKSTTECLLTHKVYNWGLTTPPSDCPLIPVPPHGRLGDLDALMKLEVVPSDNWVFRAIDNAPTIIPAEEEP
ncbi:MAG: hypothetical protein IKO00_15160 [Oscillospiraceae bacterium]|nr:hypothetical protein [Oscillospiraceae bacterium]